MNTTNITCPHCGKTFEITEAIQHQLDDELQRAKAEQSKSLKRQYDKQLEEDINKAVETALEKAKLDHSNEIKKIKDAGELEAERLKTDAKASKENEENLKKQIKELLEQLSSANKARDNAEINARKELLDKEKEIRTEAEKRASENFNTKIREQEETINRLREQLTEAKQVAEQGSQQLQGEILEIDIEKNLHDNFPFDNISEVKKGERGSDIRQVVNEQIYQNCGLILWECKNAKNFQNSWFDKLKDEMAAEKAQIGVIVFNSGEDFKQLSDNIWIVKPRYAVMLASLIREILVKVFIANRNARGKDEKVELMYNYLTGGEFSNRIRYIIESYDSMKEQLETEKKQAHKRWAAQEKIFEKITNSLYGMSGDLQGIVGQEVISLPESGDDE